MSRPRTHVSLYEILKGPLSDKVTTPLSKEPPQAKIEEPVTAEEHLEVKEEPVIHNEPRPVPAAPAYEFGEKIIKLTYNSATFFLIITLFLLFVAFSYGLKLGRKWIEPGFAATQTSGGYTIKVAQFPCATETEQRNAVAQAASIERIISGVRSTRDKTGKILVVHYGSYPDASSEDAREAIKYITDTLRKYNSTLTPTFLPLGR